MLLPRTVNQGQSSSSSTGSSGATMSGSNYYMYSGAGGAVMEYQGATENKGPSATQEIGQQSVFTSGTSGVHASSQQQVVNSKREEEDIIARYVYDVISRRSETQSRSAQPPYRRSSIGRRSMMESQSQSSSGRGGMMSSSQSSSSSGRYGNMMESQQSSMSSNGGSGSMSSSQSSSISRREAIAALLLARQNLQLSQQSATAHNADGSTDMGVQQQISLDHIHMQQQSGMEFMGKRSESGFISALAARALARDAKCIATFMALCAPRLLPPDQSQKYNASPFPLPHGVKVAFWRRLCLCAQFPAFSGIAPTHLRISARTPVVTPSVHRDSVLRVEEDVLEQELWRSSFHPTDRSQLRTLKTTIL
ncbi:hypothetical protein EIP91_000386 [Steccherinum ochraceum]|uniref:Uncharacterized protein n=1 Tax=Steccherinum ochraceum TaxID=92696 RepID=A0A4R0RFU0_9APHY|nr:hypothetical protein EIP91_000386 [Steccherinum ochraceum]